MKGGCFMATPTYTLELALDTSNLSARNYLKNYFNEVARLSNTIRRFAMRQLNLLKRDNQYKTLLKEYVALDKGNPRKKELSHQLNDIVRSYGLYKFGVEKFAKTLRSNMKYVHSVVGQKVSNDVWKSVKANLYGSGESIHFKKWDEFDSFENKSNTTGIIYDNGYVYINRTVNKPMHGIKVKVKMPRNKNSKHYQYEMDCLKDKTKYCRIVRRMFNNGWHYYVQLVQEGVPPQKHDVGKGRVGVDIGPSTAAIVSKNKCSLKELGTNQNEIKIFDKKIKKLQRQMDRSRRISNPHNYNEDSTIRKGKKKWSYSKRYYKTRNKLKTLQRKRATSIKQWQEAFANEIISDGNVIFIESMSFNGLKKKSKETKKNSKGKYQSKKRMGKSIQMHAPAQLVSIIERKLSYAGGVLFKVNTFKFKASQYDHVTDEYHKKKLSQRYALIDGEPVQRDLYSAFLLMNSESDLTHADRELCFQEYDNFKKNHDICINELKEQNILNKTNNKYPTSFGLNKL